MDLQGLRTRSIGFGVQSSAAFVLIMGLGVNACGPQFSNEHALLKSDEGPVQTYQDWCTDWQLNCPVDEPGKTAPLTAPQFQALTTILNGALNSPSKFTVSRDELNDERLKQAMTALKMDAVLQDLQSRLDTRQWQSGSLTQGTLVFNHAAPSQVRTGAGLVWNLEPVQQVTVAPGTFQFSGMALAADGAKESPVLQSLSLTDDGRFQMGLNDRTLSELPQDFALRSLFLAFGVDLAMIEGRDMELPEVIEAGAPLVGWLSQSSREIVLERAFFATSAPEMGALIPEDGLGQALGQLMSRFEKMNTSSDPARNLASVSLIKGLTARCDLNGGEVKVKFAADFGVKRVYQPKAGAIGIEFYGVEASAKKAFGLGIKLKRIELSADTITILDIPLIGKIDLKLDDVANPDQPTSLVCGA